MNETIKLRFFFCFPTPRKSPDSVSELFIFLTSPLITAAVGGILFGGNLINPPLPLQKASPKWLVSIAFGIRDSVLLALSLEREDGAFLGPFGPLLLY